MHYQQAAAEFRSLDESIETGQWRQAQLTWENSAPDGTRDGRISLSAWAREVGKSAEHIRTLWHMWNDLGRSSVQDHFPPFNESYQRTRAGDNWQDSNNMNRARSAIGKLPPEQRAQLLEDASDELPPEQQAQLVDRWLANPAAAQQVFSDPGARTRATAAIQQAQDSAAAQVAHDRQQRVQDGTRPDFEGTEAVQRVVNDLNTLVVDAGNLPQPLSSRAAQMLAHAAQRALPAVQWLAAGQQQATPDYIPEGFQP